MTAEMGRNPKLDPIQGIILINSGDIIYYCLVLNPCCGSQLEETGRVHHVSCVKRNVKTLRSEMQITGVCVFVCAEEQI